MPSLYSRLNIINNLGGLSGWLAFSLLGHIAAFGWLATHADTPVARGTTSLQVSFVQGRGNTIAGGGDTTTVLRGTAIKPPATKRLSPAVAAAGPTQPEVAIQIQSALNTTPATTTVPSEPPSPEPTNNTVATTSVIAIVSSSAVIGTGTAVDSTADALPGDAGGDGPMDSAAAGGGDWEEARLARQMRPEYPPGALAKGWEGLVLLRLRVNAKGNVQTVLIERSSGHEVLDRAAYRAARNWQFFPAREAGVPVAADVKVPVVFARERD